MVLTTLVAGWLVGSVPLAILLGRMIHGAERISARQQPRRSPQSRYRVA